MRATAILACLLLAPVVPARAAAGGFAITDPLGAQRVDYLVIAADPLAEALQPLLHHRAAQGLQPGVVTMDILRRHFAGPRELVAHAVAHWTAPAPRFLLLLGDADTVPTVARPGEFSAMGGEADLVTDLDLACPGAELEPALHVGRFPCDTAAEVSALVSKTLAYERDLAGGAWQRTVAFVCGEGGFGPEVDAMLEQLFQKIVAPGIPPGYDLRIAYANPRSTYCPWPPAFHRTALDLLNDGSLFYVYVGHGYPGGVDRVRHEGKAYRILDAADASALAVSAGRPVMIVVACHTGRFDAPQDCVGEVFLREPGGPVAFVGGSRVTQPYLNGLLGKALVDQAFGGAATLGEVLTLAKQQVLRHAPGPITQQADFLAGMAQGPAQLPAMRRDGVRHYNLLGDPALRIRRPATDLAVTLEGSTVTVRAPAGVAEVVVTLECARDAFARPLAPLPAEAAERPAAYAARWRAATDKVLWRQVVPLRAGEGSVVVTRPDVPGTYWCKAHASGHIGATSFTVAKVGEDF